MAASARDEEFDEYDKPGAERSRRRRGGDDDDDDLDSDFEGDLLEEDWLSSKKNPSELSDEELNDDLLRSDEEDQDTSAQGCVVSLNATASLGESYELQEGDEYAAEEYGATAGDEEEEYGDLEGMDYNTGGNEDEVLDLQINEPLDDEFQVEDFSAEPQEVEPDQQEMTEAEPDRAEPEEEVEDFSQVTEAEEMEAEAVPETVTKEESDEDEEEDEESGRLRFKTERKDSTVVRISDATSKRRNIPETLELTEEAKADLLQFEEKERLRKQGRFGGRGRGGARGGGSPAFAMGGFRRDGGAGRGRMNEPRPPLMPMNLQPRIIPPQSHRPQPRPSVPRGGPGLFPTPLIPIPQQPLQPLMPLRSPVPHQRPQQELHPPRHHGHAHALPHAHSNQQQQQPKNIHINPHFRGPAPSSPVQVPLISSAPNQPRPNLGPQRFPGPVDFQQHLQGNFLQPQRPLPQEQWRGPPPPPPPPPLPPHQEREPFYNSEPRFPAQPLFDLPGPAPLLNNSILPLSFPQPGPGFCPPGGGGMFQRDLPPPPPPRPNMPPPQPSPAPPAPRGFMGHRQPFPPQQHNAPFSPQHAPFGLQGLMQPQHHDPPPPPHHHPMHPHHHQQQHRQEVPPLPHHQHQHQGQPGEQHPIMHLSHSPFRQPILGGPRQMKPRPQNNMGRVRMGSPSLQQLQSLPQRNSNLRELPIAPGNSDPIRPPQPRPMVKATPNARPGQGVGGGALGRGRGFAKAVPRPGVPETKNETPTAQTSTPVQKAAASAPAQDEDEETRQYRLKIEEQKRLREEILKRKEMRRQMQAGARKKELLERLGGQAVPQITPVQTLTTPTQPQTTSTPPSVAPNGVKSRLQNPIVEQKQRLQNPQRLVPQLQSPSIAAPPEDVTPIQTQTNAVRKRTVMQRINTGSLASPQIPQKVRVVKRLTGGEEAPPVQNQPQQTIGRAAPQQRLGATRKVTVAAAGPQQPPQQQQQLDVNQSNRVVVSGRGRGRGARGGRVAPQSRQSIRVAEPQPSTVSIDGLSSSTTEKQIKNLLNSIGPIQMFKMMPQQRKAVATFVNPQHAQSFQHSFHRHMIDLSHIDVTIIDG
ncbi:RNA-binding protein 33 isoform X2 [Neoarius graeffei]|uniref:RNA-binding protein 33 isoform X2 n=1 Tax=Neoarius graeffei TaxID=443677 RepID=UPI00298CA1E7|nr:RNA-binding protein 33 isoform X2 [Neoarius graeffei]